MALRVSSRGGGPDGVYGLPKISGEGVAGGGVGARGGAGRDALQSGLIGDEQDAVCAGVRPDGLRARSPTL